jgi:4-amino-4-deoxy-L-arabinose transferase-like glycosyltransferase
MKRTLPWLAGFGTAVALSLSWFGPSPLFGDEIGYGYTASNWIAEHALAPVPAGTGRGEQGQGHPALFFWLWAILMRVFGNTLATARIIPTIATGFALVGMWRLGKDLTGSGTAGIMAAAGLLASPLFLAQAFRALPESAHMASVVWALCCYTRGQRFKAALLTVLATVFRQQAIALGAAFLVADLLRERKLGPNLLIWLTPLAVPLVNGLMHLSVNGYFIFPHYLGEQSPDMPANWLTARIRLFAGHVAAEDFRWFPVSVGLAFSFLRFQHKPGVLFLAALTLPGLLFPPTRLAFLAGVALLYGILLVTRKRLPSPPVAAMLVFIGLLVAFHVLIVTVAPDPHLNLFRYIYGAYPPLVALLMLGVRRAGRATSRYAWAVFCVASATCMTAVRYPWQPDATVAGLLEARAVRTAIASVQNPFHPDDRIIGVPALGYVSAPLQAELDDTLHVIVVTADAHLLAHILPVGYRYTGRTGYTWNHRLLSVTAFEAVPE